MHHAILVQERFVKLNKQAFVSLVIINFYILIDLKALIYRNKYINFLVVMLINYYTNHC